MLHNNLALGKFSFIQLHREHYQRLKYDVEKMLTRSKFGHHFRAIKGTTKDGMSQHLILYNVTRAVEVAGNTKTL